MRRLLPALCLAFLAPAAATAQGMAVEFGGLRQDTSQPVEITADSLSVDQTAGTAVFSGNVVVVQGDLRLSAGEVRVTYVDGAEDIEQLVASGGVTVAGAKDAAEAQQAVYNVSEGTVVMTGDVLLTQGKSAIAGERLVLNLEDGGGRIEGRVRTVFTPGSTTGSGN
jgi:lipopolysaccharide export system protein LptA